MGRQITRRGGEGQKGGGGGERKEEWRGEERREEVGEGSKSRTVTQGKGKILKMTNMKILNMIQVIYSFISFPLQALPLNEPSHE